MKLRFPSGSALRGTLYVLGGLLGYIASNIGQPHDWRSWIAFGCGATGSSFLLWRAYLDRSHERYSSDKTITDLGPAAPAEPAAA